MTFQIDLTAILRLDAVQKQIVEEEFIKMYSSWTSAAWDELDWAKVKDLRIRELLAERQKMATVAQSAESLGCPNFVKHVSTSKRGTTVVTNLG
jgi:antiviral helicase SKI2